MTLHEAITAASARLTEAGVCFGHGTQSAWDEAVWLALWRLGLPLDDLDGVTARPLTDDEAAAIDTLITRRITTRQPAAYLTGEAWLQGVPFEVDARTIVPRSLIAEVLAEGLIDAWIGHHTGQGGAVAPRDVLDLCTGNGSLAVLAAMAWPDARVHGSDLSTDALAVAARNLARHGLAERITLHQGDGLAPLADQRFDLVLCNPPYVSRASMQALPPEYRAEPALALDGGDDGMDFIRPLLRDLPAVMTDDALLVLEIGHEWPHFQAAFPRLPVVGLPCSAGDEQVLLIAASDLRARGADQ
jgi:ribosomal protein L3 glutamine methyltransferase